MSVETRDILLKAAEDVTQGMWCKGTWFDVADFIDISMNPDHVLFDGRLTVEVAQKHERCAEGSVALATALLGGGSEDYDRAVEAVQRRVGACPEIHGEHYLRTHNDICLEGFDPFEAGQQLAELFRSTAESL